MENWFSHPLTYILLLSALGLVWKAGDWYGKVNSDRKNFKDFIDRVDRKLDSIFRILSAKTIGSGSPTELTDPGRKVSGEISAEEWAAKQAVLLADDARGKTRYEIQNFSFDYVFNRHEPGKGELSLWQESAYQHGLDVSQVKNVLMIELRDALIEVLKQPEPTPTPTPAPQP